MFCLKRGAFASDSSTHIRILGLMKPFPLTCNMCDNVWNILFLNFRLFWVVLTNLIFLIKSKSFYILFQDYKYESANSEFSPLIEYQIVLDKISVAAFTIILESENYPSQKMFVVSELYLSANHPSGRCFSTNVSCAWAILARW